MSDKVHFKLDYNGIKYRFSFANKEAQLFPSLMEKIASIVHEKSYELSWKDEDSNVLLETVDDLNAAIDYSLQTLKSPSDIPCINLVVSPVNDAHNQSTEEEHDESTGVIAALATHSIVTENLFQHVKEQLRKLFASALEEDWTADLREAMIPICSPETKRLQKISEICAAEIAVQLAALKEKAPEELKAQLLQLSEDERRDVVVSDWLLEEAQKTSSANGDNERLRDALQAVRLAVELALDKQWTGNDDDDDEDDEEVEEEKEDDNSNCWLSKAASAMTKLGDRNMDTACTAPVYLCPAAFLERQKAAADGTVDVANAAPDRAARIKEYLRHLPESVSDLHLTSIPYELCLHSNHMWATDFHENFLGTREQPGEIRLVVAELIRSTAVDLPEELQLQLRGLSVEDLAKVVMLDWTHRLTEERRAILSLQLTSQPVDQTTRCPSKTLEAILYACSAASMYPDELRQIIRRLIRTDIERDDKKDEEESSNMYRRDDCDRYRQDSRARLRLASELEWFMSKHQASAFSKYMLPTPVPAPSSKSDPATERRRWSELINSLKMTDEMKSFTDEKDQPNVQTEIGVMLTRYVESCSKKRLTRLQKMDSNDLAKALMKDVLMGLWKDKEAKRVNNTETIGHNEEAVTEYSPSQLAALLFLAAAAEKSPFSMQSELESRNLCKAEQDRTSEDGKDAKTVSIPVELVAWVDLQAAAILRKGQELLAPVFTTPSFPPMCISTVNPHTHPSVMPTNPLAAQGDPMLPYLNQYPMLSPSFVNAMHQGNGMMPTPLPVPSTSNADPLMHQGMNSNLHPMLSPTFINCIHQQNSNRMSQNN